MTVLPDFFYSPPAHYWLKNARVPLACLEPSLAWLSPIPELAAPPWQEDLGAVHLYIQAGQITAIRPASQALDPDQPAWDLRQGLVWPCFVDSHTHLDKAHSWPRQANPDGSFAAAVEAVGRDRRFWSAADLYPRMEFALRCSYAHGTQALRTHLDCEQGQGPISFAVFQALQKAWAGRLTLQAVALVGMDVYTGPQAEALADLVAAYGGVLGGVIYPQPGLPTQIDRAFQLAQERGLDLDFHADESLDPQAEGLRLVAAAKLRHGFRGQVTCAHCCSLAVQSEDQVRTTLDLVQAAGLTVVSLPLCNLYLQDRQVGRMPRQRGVTLLPELAQREIAVALASDNCRDPFFAYGDHDMLEVFNQSVRIGHLDRPLGRWPQAVTHTPAQIMGLGGIGQMGVGVGADLVLFKARTLNELLSRPQSDRIVLRRGLAIDRTLPDYAELDEVLGIS